MSMTHKKENYRKTRLFQDMGTADLESSVTQLSNALRVTTTCLLGTPIPFNDLCIGRSVGRSVDVTTNVFQISFHSTYLL